MENDGRRPKSRSQSASEDFTFLDPEQGDGEEGVKVLKLSEALKKVVAAGLGAAFMTEEHIRAQLSEVKLPKEVLNMLLTNASKSKEELVKRIGNEAVKMISKIDFVKEASRFVEEHKFRVQAEIEVIKKDGASSHSEQEASRGESESKNFSPPRQS